MYKEDYQKAFEEFNQCNIREALELADKILKENTFASKVWELKGDIYFQLKQYDLSLQCYINEIKIDSSRDFVLVNKGMYLMDTEPKEALKWFNESIVLNHRNTLAWYYKSFTLYRLKEYNNALRIIQFESPHLTHRTDKNKMLLLQGFIFYEQRKIKQAIPLFEEVLESASKIEPGDIFNIFLEAHKGLIISYMALRDYEKAVNYCERFPGLSVPDMRDNEIVKTWHGYCLMGLKKFGQSLKLFDSVLENDELNLSAIYGRGIANTFLGNSDEFIKSFRSILSSNYNKDDKYDLFYVAMTLSNLNEDHVAVDHFKELLKMDPNDLQTLTGIGGSLLKLNKVEESLGYIKRALDIDKDDLYANTLEGAAYVELEDFEMAEQKLDFVLKKDNYFIEAIFQKAILCNRKNNHEEAKSLLNKILEKYPKYIPAMIVLGMVKYSIGEFDDSISYFQKIIMLDPTNATSYFHLGEAHLTKKDLTNALRCYDRAIELNRNFSEAFNARAMIYASRNQTQLATDDIKKALQLNPLSYKYHENLTRISHVTRNIPNDFLAYWNKNNKRKLLCGMLILSVFVVYFASPILIKYTSELTESDINGIKTYTLVENSKIPEIFVFGLLILIFGILFFPLLRRAKLGINQVELDFLEEQNLIIGSQTYGRSSYTPSPK